MKRFYEWCMRKCRTIVGAIAGFLPSISNPVPHTAKHGSFFKKFVYVTTVLLISAVLFAPSMYTRPFGPADYTYTGSAVWVADAGTSYRLKFLTSGTFIPKKTIRIDVFLVGGGGGGGNTADNSYRSGAGGGGGYTGTWRNIVLNANQAYSIVIGAGGVSSLAGGTSSAFGYSASGAQGLTDNIRGGNGGCGGGAAGYNAYNAPGNGGSDGSAGGSSDTRPGGTGQGTTTREFGEAGATLYAGGGGGAKAGDLGAGSPNGYGGAGGGANGAVDEGNGNSAAANTGGGGGGAKGGYNGDHWGGWGGSGICIIRNVR